MRGLMILSFAALAVAAPEGYNYPSQPPSSQYSAPSGGSGYGYQQPQPLVTKHFFIHSAPEEHDVEVQQKDIFVGTPRKNFNVVFVKSPSAAAQRTHIRVIPAVNEDKTVVYVLAKKSSEHEITHHVEQTANAPSKPEVHFIKYKTNEEAEHAQRSIQADYDRLGGSSDVINEGVSQVSSVIGSLNGAGAGAGAGTVSAGFGSSGFGSAGFGSNGFGSNGFGSNGLGSDGLGSAGLGSGGHGSSGFGSAAFGSAGFGSAGFVSAGQGSASFGHGSANSAYLPPVKKH